MEKRVAKIIGAVAVLAVIAAIGSAFLGGYGRSKAAEQGVIAQGYIKKVVRSFKTEDLSEFKQYLHPDLVVYLETSEGKQLVSLLGKIGKLNSIEESKWVSSNSAVSTSKGHYEFSNYEVRATFQHGEGLVKITTIPDGEGHLVTNFQLFSEYFATLQ